MKFIPGPASNAAALRKIQGGHPVLGAHVAALRAAYKDYLAKNGSPTRVSSIGLAKAEADALEDVYSGETIKFGVRWIGKYRQARNLSHCPLCGSHHPSQLEHYLPKAHYPEFTIFSWNLVPTCAICNPKRGHHAHQPGHLYPLIHPYLETDLAHKPLFSATIRPPYAAVTFAPKLVGPYSEHMMRRLEWQLEKCFDLNRFDIWMTAEWRNFHNVNYGTFTSVGELQERLFREHKTRAAISGANAWDTILFRAVLADAAAQYWLLNTAPVP